MAYSTPEEFNELLVDSFVDLLLDEPPSVSGPKKDDYSDNLLCELAGRYCFHPSAFVRGNIKLILARFYDFYFNGTVRNGDNLAAVVGDAIAIGRTINGPVFSAQNSDHAVNIYSPNVSTDSNDPSDAVGLALKLNQQCEKLSNTEKEMMRSFCLDVTRIISNISVQGKATSEEVKLLRLTGYLALSLLRYAINDEELMTNARLKEKYRISVTANTDWGRAEKWMPPCKKCTEMCVKGLAKGSSHTSAFFAIIVKIFYDTRDRDVTEYLCGSVLTYCENYELGVLSMMSRVCKLLDIDWKQLRFYSTSADTKQSWLKISEFHHTYWRKDKPEYTYPWARVIDDRYLRGYSEKENMFLCMVFASTLEICDGPQVWVSLGVDERKKNMSQYYAACQLGRKIYCYAAPKFY